MPDTTPAPVSRRQIMLGSSALAVASGLSSWWRYSSAAQVMPEPPDDRPLMNAIQDNDFTRALRQWGRELGLPKAILVVSAHWLTERGVQVSVSQRPARGPSPTTTSRCRTRWARRSRAKNPATSSRVSRAAR